MSPLKRPDLKKGKAQGIPHRFTGETPAQVKQAFDKFLRQPLLDYLENRDPGWPGISFHGQMGRGKSGVCVEAQRLFEDFGFSSRFTTQMDMTCDIKDTWGKDNESETGRMDKYLLPALLVVDEIGIGFDSEAEKNIIYRILVGRHNACLPTLMTTNFNLENEEDKKLFVGFVGNRVYDRLSETIIKADAWGPNLRRLRKAA